MAAEDPKVTVLISTYNKASTLKYAVDSVLWQTMEDFELWVIGDGCTDSSAELIRGYEDERVNWFNLPENTGYQSEPHNEGLRRAKGKYIAYLNHDDIWLPNHLELLVKKIEEDGVDFVYSILEWVLLYAENYADIPRFPGAPRPPEASASMHYRSLVDEIGWWKPPDQTFTVPRAEFFRRAQFIDKNFQLVPYLTILKFGGNPGEYGDLGEQAEYMKRIQEDPNFAEHEMGVLAASAYAALEKPVGFRRYGYQLGEAFRRFCIKRKIDPSRLLFWQKRGHQIRAWHKLHKLERN